MPLTACYDCGKQISTAALTCPQCGAPKLTESAFQVTSTDSTFSATVQDKLKELSKIGKDSIIAWVIVGFFIPSVIVGRNPIGTLVAFLCAILASRAWFRRRTARAMLKRGRLENFAVRIYLPALWSYAWRSGATFICLSFAVGALGGETKHERAVAIASVIGMWIVPSLLILDVPFWVRRRLRRIANSSEFLESQRDGTIQSIKKALPYLAFGSLLIVLCVGFLMISHRPRQETRTAQNSMPVANLATAQQSSVQYGDLVDPFSLKPTTDLADGRNSAQANAVGESPPGSKERGDIVDPFTRTPASNLADGRMSEKANTVGYPLATAFGARSSPLSGPDCEILFRVGTEGALWNRNSTQLFQHYFDERVTLVRWVAESQVALVELGRIVTSLESRRQFLIDEGVKETLGSIFETMELTLSLYQELKSAIADSDFTRQANAIKQLKSVESRKQGLTLPIVEKLRSSARMGAIDSRLKQLIAEMGDLNSPR